MNGGDRNANVQAVLLDIEGTTTPITFVVETLFPYARRHLRDYLRQHATSLDHAVLVEHFRGAWKLDRDIGAPPWVEATHEALLESVAAYSEWLMDRDRKSTPLKTLQGRIWEQGYARGELVGEVFADVPVAFDRWRAGGVHIGIFSSGSVLAQQLLFKHSSAGDLSGRLRWHFDTTIGAKGDPDSYVKIAAATATPPATILFVSDVIAELDAARSAGMRTVLSIRLGNVPQPPGHGHPAVHSFDDVLPVGA